MRLHDTMIGLLFVVLGLAAFAYGFTLVPPRHLPYGPGFFPQIVGAGMALTGGILALRSLPSLKRGSLVDSPAWMGSAAGVLRFLSIPVALVFFIYVVVPLGFTLTAWIILAALFRSGGIRPLMSVATALVISIAMTLMFASLLGVPLPWGLLTPVSGWFL